MERPRRRRLPNILGVLTLCSIGDAIMSIGPVVVFLTEEAGTAWFKTKGDEKANELLVSTDVNEGSGHDLAEFIKSLGWHKTKERVDAEEVLQLVEVLTEREERLSRTRIEEAEPESRLQLSKMIAWSLVAALGFTLLWQCPTWYESRET